MKNLAGINYVETGDLTSQTKVVMLHGYGANMMDLFPLAQEINPQLHWIFPDGVLEVPIGPFMTGRGWFQIDFPQFERSIRAGEFSESNPQGLTEARKKIEVFLKELKLDPQNTILGGFSQGAMLSLDLTLTTNWTPSKLILMSGTLIKKKVWKELIPNKKIPYFQSHGTHDPVLPYPLAEELNLILQNAGWQGEFESFRGGHEIPYSVIEGIQSFLDQ